jgi:hypothetical protein
MIFRLNIYIYIYRKITNKLRYEEFKYAHHEKEGKVIERHLDNGDVDCV